MKNKDFTKEARISMDFVASIGMKGDDLVRYVAEALKQAYLNGKSDGLEWVIKNDLERKHGK